MVFPYRQTFSSTVRAAAYTINVQSEAKYKVWHVNHEFCCMENLDCSKIFLIHIHPSRHCRHACHLSACSFYNRSSAVAACHHCFGWAIQPRANFWNRTSAVAACHLCLGRAGQPRANFWNRASAVAACHLCLGWATTG